MVIGIKTPLLKQMWKDSKPFVEGLFNSYWESEKMKQDLDSENGFRSVDVINIELPKLNNQKLQQLHDMLLVNEAPAKTVETVKRWQMVLKDPSNGEVTSLSSLNKVFGALMGKLKNKWLFFEEADGELVPVLVKSFKYYPPRKDESQHFTISVVWGYLFPSGEDDSKPYHQDTDQFYFYSGLINDNEDAFTDDRDLYTGEDESEEESEEDDEAKPKKKSKKPKQDGIKLSVILGKKKLFIPTPDMFDKYSAQMKKFHAHYILTGHQFTINGNAFIIDRYDGYRNNYSFRLAAMIEDDEKNRLVIDNDRPLNEIKRLADTEQGSYPLPYHPYIKMYDITKYRAVVAHIDKLEAYQYNPKLIEQLVLPKANKELLNALIGGENNFADIISGKSGGIIILGSGAAGTGKTLTAEVYSEVVKKPLYSIQSSQLGIDVQEIEKNLHRVLRRADRWGAVLLIDECDSYVSKRGSNMVQNAVVGVFLRLLEYYKGILFLTTNRHDDIDQAIISRLTAHIRYTIPSRENQIEILERISSRFQIKISDTEKTKLLEKYPHMVGRDIRNLLKMIKKFYHKEKSAIQLTAKMVEPISEFIPFVNEKHEEAK